MGLKVLDVDRANLTLKKNIQVMEQEVIDMTNAIARDGLVFFPDFCSVVLMKFRFLTTVCESPKLLFYFKDKRTRSSSLSFHSR